jgi:hypothetical protein
MWKLRRHNFQLAGLITMLMFAGCAATELVNQWSNPAYTAPSFKRVMVIAVSKQPTIRRNFEDAFVAQLKAAGVDAVPSYQYIPDEGQVEEGQLNKAVLAAGADAALITRLLRKEQKTDITPGYYQPVPTLGFYGWYSGGWAGYYEPPSVYQYDVYISETSLYDVTKNQVVWSGIAQTTAPGDINKEIKNYAEITINALKEKKLI